MVTRILTLPAMALASVLAVIAITPARAESMACADADGLKSGLAKNSHETPVGVAVDFMGRPIVLFLSPAGTYTLALMVAGRDGRRLACVQSMGQGWQTIAPPVPGKPS